MDRKAPRLPDPAIQGKAWPWKAKWMLWEIPGDTASLIPRCFAGAYCVPGPVGTETVKSRPCLWAAHLTGGRWGADMCTTMTALQGR